MYDDLEKREENLKIIAEIAGDMFDDFLEKHKGNMKEEAYILWLN